MAHKEMDLLLGRILEQMADYATVEGKPQFCWTQFIGRITKKVISTFKVTWSYIEY